jgi:hypothetical protein
VRAFCSAVRFQSTGKMLQVDRDLQVDELGRDDSLIYMLVVSFFITVPLLLQDFNCDEVTTPKPVC